MSAELEAARALLSNFDRLSDDARNFALPYAQALRALIAEHERQLQAFDGYAATIRAAEARAERAEAEVARLTTPPTDAEREALGRRVREVWIEWAREQPEPKPSWLVPWNELGPADREVDMRIGEALAGFRRQGPITDDRTDRRSHDRHDDEIPEG